MIASIPAETIFEMLKLDESDRAVEKLVVMDYAYYIRDKQLGIADYDWPAMGKAIRARFGIRGLKRIVDKAWKRHRAWCAEAVAAGIAKYAGKEEEHGQQA